MVLNFIDDDAGQIGRMLGHQQALRPTVQAISQDSVVAAVANHLHHALLESADFFAQHIGLALLQTDRTLAMWTDKSHIRQKLGMTLKKVWRVHQKIGDIVFCDRGN